VFYAKETILFGAATAVSDVMKMFCITEDIFCAIEKII
jgi:hypothetical protein